MELQITKNIFEKYSEKSLLIVGLIFLLLGSVCAYFFNARYDGVVDLHFAENVNWAQPFIDNAVNTLCLALPLFFLGKYINKSTRFVDILAASLIARVQFYFLPLFNINNFMTEATDEIMGALSDRTLEQGGLPDISLLHLFILFCMAVFAIAFLVLFVLQLYRGFKTATNCKLQVHKLYFALAIIVAEILSKIILSYLII